MLAFTILVFACFRISQFIVFDEGPFSFMLRIRIRAGVYDRGENGHPETNLGRLFNCPYCTGIWVSLALALIISWHQPLFALLLWWGMAGGQAFLQAVSER